MKVTRHSTRLLIIIFLSLTYSVVYPCTTFVIRQENKIIFGRNLDWITGSGLIMTNSRHIKKRALVDPSEEAIEWTSKYGSMSFNQVGRDFPYGGINEAGLVVEHMTLEQTEYPSKDNRYAISATQWIQFQLDNYSTVAEVIASDTLLRIVDATTKIHYLVSDQYGHAATIEFLNGKMISHVQQSLPIPVLANSPYSTSLKCFKSDGDTDSNPSLYNFCTAAGKILEIEQSSDDRLVATAFEILQSVSQGLMTKWSIVYDVTNMRIYFKIFETPVIVCEQKIFTKDPGQANIKFVDFNNFNFDCSRNSKVFDLNDSTYGAIDEQFYNYSTKINEKIITETFTFFEGWGFLTIDAEQIDYLAKYPESFICLDE